MQAPLLFLFFGSPSWLEFVMIGMAALMIFGSRLPDVALRAVAHVMRARRAVTKMWRDTGLEEELRKVRRDIELSVPREADFQVKSGASKKAAEINDARAAAERAREAAERSARQRGGAGGEVGSSGSGSSESVDPDAHRRGEVTLEPAQGSVASGEYSADADYGGASVDPSQRDMIPGVDRQEVAAAEDPADLLEESLGGDHFGAGLVPPPKDGESA